MNESKQVAVYLRASVQNAVISILAAFAIGVVGGWSIAQWSRTRTGSIGGLVISLAGAIFLASSYYRTRGLLHLKDGPD